VGAAEIFWGLEPHVAGFLTADTARAIIDLNRAEDDRRRDGIVKTHTCWDVPVYSEPLPGEVILELIEKYHRPYHGRLTELAGSVCKFGIDCHTMAERGPPVGPDPGKARPEVCLSHAGFTCPEDWFLKLGECFEKEFSHFRVSLNEPFKGGYIIRVHSGELPWVQLELSRAHFLDPGEKRDRILGALSSWFKIMQ
jgi:N-formylglutamate amidohydrolase